MKALMGVACVLVIATLTLQMLLAIPGAHAQLLDPSNISAISQIPRSQQRPSMAGVAGVATATVLFVVFSCSFVFVLGMYEEFCTSSGGKSTASKSSYKRSATVGSRYGGSRYRPPNTNVKPTA